MPKIKPLFILTITSLAILFSTSVSARQLTKEERKYYAQNNIIFTVPCDSEADCQNGTTTDPTDPETPTDPTDPTNPPSGSNTIAVSFGGANFNMVNTAILPTDYVNKACSQYHICQSHKSEWGNKCDAFSRTNAADMYYGNYTTSLPNYQAGKFSSKSDITDSSSAGLQQALTFIYNQIMSGKPVVLSANVCRRNKPSCSSSRHFITIVGVRQGVSASSIQETDLLYVDPWGSTLAHTGQSNSRKMRFDSANGAWYMYVLN